MQSFLIIGSGEAAQKRVDDLVKEFGEARVQGVDLSGISDVRELIRATKLSSNKSRVFVCNNFGDASEEAQNAFLKTLEEPGEGIYIVLISESMENVLPTIISRCKVFYTEHNEEVDELYQKTVSDFIEGAAGDRLSAVKEIRSRDEAVLFLKNTIVAAHKNRHYLLAERAMETLGKIKANGNVGLQLTNLTVALSSRLN